MSKRIYLDNAATSWPKPESVYAAVDHYQRQLGSPAGRGSYREAAEVERLVRDTRKSIADLIRAESAERIVFTFNGTDSLNLAIHGVLRSGDHVITSVVEHNSVLRPLRQLENRGVIQVTRIACDTTGVIDPDHVRGALRANTRLIVLLHASNVTGAIQPLEAVGEIARQSDVLLLVDAAQSLGHIPIDVAQLGAHLLAAPGHKGLLGPLGTGFLYLAPGVEQSLHSIRQGGTGSRSDEDLQPEYLPDKYEAGNLNVPGLVGLHAGVAHVMKYGVDSIRSHELGLATSLVRQLAELKCVHVFGPDDGRQRVGVVSFSIEGYDSREVASMLDASFAIQTRAGFHCAPLLHRRFGTNDRGGLVRLSPGVFNSQRDIDQVLAAIKEIADARMHVAGGES